MTTSPGIPPPPLRLGDAGATGGSLWSGRQTAVETASPLAGLDLDCTRLALSVARAANGPLLSGKGRAIAPQTECLKLAAISAAHPAAVVGTGIPTLRGWTDNEAIVMPTAPSLERDSAAGWRTSGN
jgi:hypothetical protein